MSAPGEFDSLKEAWSVLGQRVVARGTEEEFPEDGPSSTYAALFHQRRVFDKARYSFVVQGNAAEVEESLAKLLSRCQAHGSLCCIVQEVYRRLEALMDARSSRIDVPEEFVRDAWPAYVAA